MQYYNQQNYLAHYGIPGMKWGRRKARSTSATTKKSRPPKRSQDYKEYKALKRRNRKSLSNAELKKLNERMNLEQNYSKMKPSTVQKGMKALTTTAAVTTTLITLVGNYDKLAAIGKRITGVE